MRFFLFFSFLCIFFFVFFFFFFFCLHVVFSVVFCSIAVKCNIKFLDTTVFFFFETCMQTNMRFNEKVYMCNGELER